MSKDAIMKILITIIVLMVFIWLWHIISRMINRDTDPYDLAFVGIDFSVDSNRGSGGNHCVCC